MIDKIYKTRKHINECRFSNVLVAADYAKIIRETSPPKSRIPLKQYKGDGLSFYSSAKTHNPSTSTSKNISFWSQWLSILFHDNVCWRVFLRPDRLSSANEGLLILTTWPINFARFSRPKTKRVLHLSRGTPNIRKTRGIHFKIK